MAKAASLDCHCQPNGWSPLPAGHGHQGTGDMQTSHSYATEVTGAPGISGELQGPVTDPQASNSVLSSWSQHSSAAQDSDSDCVLWYPDQVQTRASKLGGLASLCPHP